MSSVTFNHTINKIDNNNTICSLIMTINKNIFKEINDVKCFDIYINNNYSEKYNWLGLKKYTFQNNNVDKEKIENNEDNVVSLEFICLFKEKGEYDLNQLGMIIYSNIPRQQEKKIHKILSPIIVKIE